MFAGVAAARIRDLFAQARAFAPSIIFIGPPNALNSTPIVTDWQLAALTPPGSHAFASTM